MTVDMTNLAEAVEDAFGETAVIVRNVPGTYSLSLGTTSTASTVTDTILADEQARQHLSGGNAETHEVVYNVRAAALTNLGGTIKPGDIITKAGISRRVVRADLQAGKKIWRVVCRTEKRA